MAMASSPSKQQILGWMFKWTNYLEGYQLRYFILENGLLSYYRSDAEVADNCRGAIHLPDAQILKLDATDFVVQTLEESKTWHLRAQSENEQKLWMSTLEAAKMERAAAKLLSMTMGPSCIAKKTKVSDDLETLGAHPDLKVLKTSCEKMNKLGSEISSVLMAAKDTEDEEEAVDKLAEINQQVAHVTGIAAAMLKFCKDYTKIIEVVGEKQKKKPADTE